MDFAIREPSYFEPGWYSHKFKGAGLRYEMGVCIQTGWIVWMNGPYPCGAWSDLKIFNFKLKHMLDEDENAVADGGYKNGGNKVATPGGVHTINERMKGKARARHENVNGRLKMFAICNTKFRHSLTMHHDVVMAVANIVQLGIQSNISPIGQVYYNDVLFPNK